ncbi:uncharacterized protein LOC134945420 [Pseudophryne corroboree]|uniref:uncharacterized protein LOC134945420 n=1 Tax=Pseudophryne corroboree TaxID=495146 RepID=UPI0030815612
MATPSCPRVSRMLRCGWRSRSRSNPPRTSRPRSPGRPGRRLPDWRGKASALPTTTANASKERVVVFATHVGCAEQVTRPRNAPRRQAVSLPLPPRPVELASKAFSPIIVPELQRWLSLYPDEAAASFLLEGFQHGFRLPIPDSVYVVARQNLRSAREFPQEVRRKVDGEIGLGRMAGPYALSPLPSLCISPVGVVPKKAIGKFRLIQHLSHPPGLSVNDAIPEAQCRVQYQSFDDALRLVRDCGPGSLLAKLDVESAFRLLPLHPDSLRFLGFKIGGEFYVDRCLPMGCSVSCAYFECFSIFLHWCVQTASGQLGVAHYLDDFLFVGPGDSSVCGDILSVARSLFCALGVPVAQDKCEGPCTCLSYLGIEIDTVGGCCRLPEDKVRKLLGLITDCLGKRRVRLKHVQSLLGSLNFACRIIPMGRIFCRKLERATAGTVRQNHSVYLSREIKDDLWIWVSFLVSFNREVLWPAPCCSSKQLQLFTDASGSLGFGAFFAGAWCAAAWPASWVTRGFTKNLLLLELFPILVALELWAGRFANRDILFLCDNLGVVHAINNQRSSSPQALRLLRHLVLVCLQCNINFRARHVPGVDNGIADALSRFQFDKFRKLVPGAEAEGLQCPPSVWQMVEAV